MKYKITVYKTDMGLQVIKQTTKPTLEQLQSYVKGYIELVPEEYYTEANDWFKLRHKGKVDAVWCNEEGLLQLPIRFNPFFSPAPWGDMLAGDIAVVEKV